MSSRGMFRGRGRSGTSLRGRGSSAGNSSRFGAKGLYADGEWLCDCDPRLPAQLRQVKKDSPNRGRWFYTCTKSKGRECGFFLWEEEAREIQEAARLPNLKPTRSPASVQKNNAEISVASTNNPSISISAIPDAQPQGGYAATRAGKRSRQEFEDDEDHFEWNISPEEAQELSKAADTPFKPPITPETPTDTGTFKTPSKRQLPWLKERESSHGLPTPKTNQTIISAFARARAAVAREISPSPMSRDVGVYSERPNHRPSPSASPSSTPASTSRSLKFEDPHISGAQEMALLTEASDLLEAEKIVLNESTQIKLTELLKKHSLRAQGLSRGRDVARAGLKARDMRIVELQHRIATLEAELNEKQAIINHLNWEKETGYAP